MAGTLTEDMKRVIGEQRLGFIATVCADGTPNLSPKGTTAVWDDNHIVFADIRSPGTIKNLKSNPVMEINVVDPFARKGYRFKGRAEIITQGELFEAIQQFYATKWVDTNSRKADLHINAFVLMKVSEARPLISPSYDAPDADEGEIRREWVAHFEAVNRAALQRRT